MLKKMIKQFVHIESASGFILIFCAILAMILSNSPLANWYNTFIYQDISIGFLQKPLKLWVNDFGMAWFFLLIGLELNREFSTGFLSAPKAYKIPLTGAIGGLIVPIIIFIACTYNTDYLNGWPIPAATDIAFTLAIISLIKNVPKNIKVILVAITIFDDIAAIGIIGLFYTASINYLYLFLAIMLLFSMPAFFKTYFWQSLLWLGLLLWFCVFKSGIHATLAGILLSMMIPKDKINTLETMLHPIVAFAILPIFALVNSGVDLSFANLEKAWMHPLVIAITLGLFLGKQLGVTGFIYLGYKLGLYKVKNFAFKQMYAAGILTGIGFTMSLFIGYLAFDTPYILNLVKVGVTLGSLLSIVVGLLAFKYLAKKT